MQTVHLNPMVYPGVQQFTVTPTKSKEKYTLTISGAFPLNSSDGYIDVYKDFVADSQQQRLLTSTNVQNVVGVQIQLPPANSYIFKSNLFTGFMTFDLGQGDNVGGSALSGATATPPYQFNVVGQTFTADTYTEDLSGSVIDFNSAQGSVIWALIPIVNVTINGTLGLYLEESNDGVSGWTDATYIGVAGQNVYTSAGLSAVLKLPFLRTKRYVRARIQGLTGLPSEIRLAIILQSN